MKRNFSSISTQRGQATAEYIVGCLVILVVLGVLNLGGDKDESMIDKFLELVEKSYDGLSTFISLPL